MKSRPDWDTYFINICDAVALRADCSRAQIGAVIVKDNRIVSTGYNGAPSGKPGCLKGACPRANSDSKHLTAYDNCISIHAESNALLYASRSGTEGATIYINYEPCHWCHKLIRGAGIIRTVYKYKDEIVVIEEC